TPGLKCRCPPGFRSHPGLTHLNQMISSLPGLWRTSRNAEESFSPLNQLTPALEALPLILCLLVTKIRKVSSAILYCSLAVSDLFLLLSLFFKAHYHFHGNHWVLGETACRVVTACFYGNLYCSAMTLACISIKRYLAVVYPFLYKSMPKRMCAAWVSLALWGVFGVAIIPELIVQQSYWLPQLNRTTCHDVLPLDHSSHMFLLYYHLILIILFLMVPLVVTIVCFTRIINELTRSHFDWRMYIKASSLVFSIFLVCFIPSGVLHFVHYVQLFVNGTETLYMYFNVAVCLCCVHACLDPFLFLLIYHQLLNYSTSLCSLPLTWYFLTSL
uniref:Coagulation factor II thrombin receptor like 2 n=1 Tax=Pundamilia nyererei TaxID=303518 RepID=A0A3B4FEM4_9CICH